MSKKIKFLLISLFLLLPMPILAISAYSNERVVIDKDQVVEGNLYVAGEVIEIYGTVNGDIFAAGQNIYIDSDNINGDIFSLSENIYIKGDINGTARMLASKSMLVTDARLKNIMALGEDLRISSESSIDRHLSFLGKYLTIAGPVGGKVEGMVSNFILDNQVDGDIDIYIGPEKDNSNMRLTDNASIGGVLYYKAWDKFEINTQADLSSEPVYNKIVKKDKPITDHFMSKLVEFFQMLVVGMIFIYLAPKYLNDMYKRVRKHKIASLLKGLGFLVLTPLACILLAITVIGIPVAIIFMVFWSILLYLGFVMTSWFLGKFLHNKIIKNKKLSELMILAIGILAMIILSAVPLVGPIIIAITYLMAWGIFYDTFYKFKKK